MKQLLLLLGILLLVGTASAVTWVNASGCWTATDGSYSLVMWNATGNSSYTIPSGVTSIEYLIIAGGGAGGSGGVGSGGGAGGGAGGVLNTTSYSVVGNSSYTIMVGSGGIGAASTSGTNGTNSSIFNASVSLPALGGGGGAKSEVTPGKSGGSGGGAGGASGSAGSGGTGLSGQGYAGGANNAANPFQPGSGGGAGAVGTAAGAGGIGRSNSITGTATIYSGGGGISATVWGGANTSGGSGGGGKGASAAELYGFNGTDGGGGGGGYSGKGGNGGSGMVIIKHLFPPYITSNFTCSPLGLTTSATLSCVDRSTASGAVITNYSWTFEDSIPQYATTQNAAITYTSNGVWDVTLGVYNATTGWNNLTRPNYVTVSASGNLSGWNRQDIMMDQIYTLTLNVKDASTLFGIPGATVLTSNGDNTTTSAFGVATITTNYTALVVTVGASGYYSRSVSYVVDRDRTETLYLTAIVAPVEGTPLTYYSPWQVRIRIADFNGNPLPGTNITANYVATTLPSTNVSWLINAFGINSAVAEQMVDSGTAMAGTTDSNGGLSFTMFKSIMYSLAITNTTAGISSTKTLYPSDQEYLIRVALPGQAAYNNTLSQMANTSLPVYQLNTTAYNLSVIYRDTSGLTTNVQFQVKWRNGTFLHNQSLGNPGTGVVVGNYTILNPGIGKEVIWLFNATRSGT